jgi:HNH endonuclease
VNKSGSNNPNWKGGISKMKRLCIVEGCNKFRVGRGKLCSTHHSRYYKHGNVLKDKPYIERQYRNWRGGVIYRQDGRVLLYEPDHPYPNNSHGTHVFRYRLVMEEKLGRYLEPDEIVHHLNGNSSDDRIENLVVMTQSEHARIHNFGR